MFGRFHTLFLALALSPVDGPDISGRRRMAYVPARSCRHVLYSAEADQHKQCSRPGLTFLSATEKQSMG